MDSMDVNKAAAAILVAGIAFSAFGFVSKIVVHPTMPHHAAIRMGDPTASAKTATSRGMEVGDGGGGHSHPAA